MRNVIWIVVAAIILGGGYLLYTGKSVQEVAQDAATLVGADADVVVEEPETAPEVVSDQTEAPVETEAAVEDVVDEATTALEDAANDAEDAAQTAVDRVETAVNEAEEALTDTTDTLKDALDDAANNAGDALETAAEDADASLEPTEEVANDDAPVANDDTAQAETPTPAPSTEVETSETVAAEILTPEGFDLQKAQDLIDNSDLGGLQKTVLKAALEQAEANPELLKDALDRVREALNL